MALAKVIQIFEPLVELLVDENEILLIFEDFGSKGDFLSLLKLLQADHDFGQRVILPVEFSELAGHHRGKGVNVKGKGVFGNVHQRSKLGLSLLGHQENVDGVLALRVSVGLIALVLDQFLIEDPHHQLDPIESVHPLP